MLFASIAAMMRMPADAGFVGCSADVALLQNPQTTS
jgi:hypothetical protein